MIRNIKNLLELFAYLYCLAELFGKKLKINIYAVVLVILGLFLLTGINRYGFPEYLLSLLYIGVFSYGLLYYRESVKITLINCVLALIIVAVLQLFMFLPLYYFFFRKYEQEFAHELLINVASFGAIIFCSHKIKLKKLSDFFVKRNKLIVGISVFVLCVLGVNFYQMVNTGKIYGATYIQTLFLVLIFLFTIYEWQKTKTDAEKKKAQLEMNRLYYDAYDQLIMLVRERQHDMKSHINAILGMIYATDNYEELVEKQKEYCGYVIEQNEKTKLVLSTGNPLISGFLYSKIQEMEDKGIEFEYQVGIKGEDMIIPEYELIEMMGILIDNAIEALDRDGGNNERQSAEESDNEKFRKIYLSLKDVDNRIELSVANASCYYEEDMTEYFFESGYSSKGRNRGIGLSKLKRMIHDKGGDIIVSNEVYEERNYLVFMIKLPKKDTIAKNDK